MTRLQKDAQEVIKGFETEVLRKRRAEIDSLEKAGRCEKNGFRRTCIAQELARKVNEYNLLDDLAEGIISIEDLD